MTAGKRRTAREMAVQMLYQSDLGGSPLPNIFSTFDLAEYLARPGASAGRRAAAPARRQAAEAALGQEPGPAVVQAVGPALAPGPALAQTVGPAAAQTAGPAAAQTAGPAAAQTAGPAAPAEPVLEDEKEAVAPPLNRADYGRQKRRVEEAFQYAQALVRGTVDHREEIDSMIRGQADNWRLERMPPVDRNILRLAIFEMLYESDTPKLVVVDEAIELAKKFGSEQSGRFVNGLLDGLLKQHTFPGSLT